jgi:hypothetical protein
MSRHKKHQEGAEESRSAAHDVRNDNNAVLHDGEETKSESTTVTSLCKGIIQNFDDDEECQAFLLSSDEPIENETNFFTNGEDDTLQRKDLQPLLLKFFEDHQKREKEQEQKVDQEKKDMDIIIEKSGLYDTKTIHMLAVAAVVDSSSSTYQGCCCSVKSLLLVFCSLLLLMTQSFCLNTILSEVSYPVCATHSDCLTGDYCYMRDNGITRQPMCAACDLFEISDDRDFINICESLDEVTNIDGEVDQTYIWIDQKKNLFYNETKYPSEYAVGCLAWQHCQQTSMFQSSQPANVEEAKHMAENINSCDYLALVKNKFNGPQMAVFVFMVFIFASSMSSDMEEAAIEEALLLNAAFKNDSFVNIVPAQLLLVSLRYRRFILPWAIGAAVIAVSLTNDLSIVNILLNVLALEFLLNADSLVASFLCKSSIKDCCEFVHEMIGKAANDNVVVSWWRARVESCVVSLAMIIVVMHPSVVDVFFNSFPNLARANLHLISDLEEISCGRMTSFLAYMSQSFGPFLFFIPDSVSILYVYFISSRKSYLTVVSEENDLVVVSSIVPTNTSLNGNDRSDVKGSDRKTCKILELIIGVTIPIITSFCAWTANYLFLLATSLFIWFKSETHYDLFVAYFNGMVYLVLMLIFWSIYIIAGQSLTAFRSRDE